MEKEKIIETLCDAYLTGAILRDKEAEIAMEIAKAALMESAAKTGNLDDDDLSEFQSVAMQAGFLAGVRAVTELLHG